MKNLEKIGGISAFYLAASYLVGIVIFLFILDYPHIVDPAQKMNVLVNHQALLVITNILMYVLFGLFLVLFNLALYTRLHDQSPTLMSMAAATGMIWAALLIGSGMVANAGIAPAVRLFQENPAQGTAFWLGIETVANGLGGQNGEILGGVMTLLISLAGIRGGLLPRILNYLGIFIGTVGIISTIPGLSELSGLFGLSQIIWFIGIGMILLKTSRKERTAAVGDEGTGALSLYLK